MMEEINQIGIPDHLKRETELLLTGLSSVCSKQETNLVIHCDNEIFHCHKVILKARSLILSEQIEGCCDNDNLIHIHDVKASIMNSILKYIYTDQIMISEINLVDITAAAAKFQLPFLLNKCCHFFQSQVNNNISDALDMLLISEQFSLQELSQIAVKKLNKNRTLFLREAGFRQKLLEHPLILLRLYEEMSIGPEEELSRVSELWTCGYYCQWCGMSPA